MQNNLIPVESTRKTVREVAELDMSMLSGIFISELKLNETFSINDKVYQVVKRTKGTFIKHDNIKYTKVVITIQEQKTGIKHIYHFWSDYYKDNNKMKSFIYSNKTDILGRDIEGLIMVDLINETNPFHKKSDVYNKLENFLKYGRN